MIRKKYKKLDYNTEDLESLSNSDLKKIAELKQIVYLCIMIKKKKKSKDCICKIL